MPVTSSTNTPFKQPNYNNNSGWTLAGGILAGVATAEISLRSRKYLSNPITEKIQELSYYLSEADKFTLNNALKNAITDTGLDKKGVEIIKVTTENKEKVRAIISTEISKDRVGKFYPQAKKERKIDSMVSRLIKGRNAYFTPHTNKILLPDNKLMLASLHEVGHAMNQHFSKTSKIFRNIRPILLLTIPVFSIGLLKAKKAPDQPSEGLLDKSTTFIKENAGKLTLLFCTPKLIEEGLASINGNKLARKLLSPELAGKVIKTNGLAYLSYLIASIFLASSIYLGIKIKDMIVKPKPIEIV